MLNIVFSFGFSCMANEQCVNAEMYSTNLYRCLLSGGDRSCCWRGRRHSNLLDVKLRLQADIRKSTGSSWRDCPQTDLEQRHEVGGLQQSEAGDVVDNLDELRIRW